MSASLPMKLALFIAVLAGSLTVMLYRVHKATQFQATDPRGEFWGTCRPITTTRGGF